jgi:hypothetical protein
MGALGVSKCGNSVKKDDAAMGDKIGAIAPDSKGLVGYTQIARISLRVV